MSLRYFLVGLLLGAGLCYVVGVHVGFRLGMSDLHYLMEMPTGGIYMSSNTGAVWSKLSAQQIHFVRVPNPEQARLIRLFNPVPAGAPPPPPPSTERDNQTEEEGGKQP